MSNIVVDKCFLQSSKTSRIHELAASHRLLVSEALFYEMLTTSEPARSRCFAKFPPIDNPVDLVSHIGTLMRIEIDTHRSAGKPSAHRVQVQFQFNPKLLNAGYELPATAEEAIQEQFHELRNDSESMLTRALSMQSFFPSLLTGTQAERVQAKEEAELLICQPGTLLQFYSALESPPGERRLPPVDLVTDEWAIYRWLQVQFLFALDLYVRYQGKIPVEMGSAAWEKLEHDVLDAEVLMLGCLEGAFATNEKKLIRWWRMLCPNGTLYE
ncbi:hypothetical protein AAGS40_00900 [Paraburkholderia sp. PREW-6R]|uniref:hypothetical protein n=1 Tax=Paraburkholderia sp. PREW-6R TaxID=3141544 RepID=UPI0031F50C99